MAAKIANVQEVAPELLVFYDRNAKIHSPEQVEALKNSIREFGFLTPCLIDKDMNLIAGHGRVMAAKELGMQTVPCVLIEGLSEKQRRAYIMADNRLAEMAEWNMEIVFEELQDLAFDGFDVSVIGFNFDMNAESVAEARDGAPEDHIPEDVTPKSKAGNMYRLGDHLLLCGDSTSEETIRQLMGGDVADLLLTDPPYGISVVRNNTVGGGGPLHFGTIGGGGIVPARAYREVVGDDTTDAARANYELAKRYSKNQIIFGGNYFTDFLRPSRCWIVWDKQNGATTFADAELAWTSYDRGVKLYQYLWSGLVREGSRAVEGISRVHPTQKPVGMLSYILRDFTQENDIILDCFGGSGSTLIACEQMNRACRMIEIDPYYIDVIITRWEQLTGGKAELINGD